MCQLGRRCIPPGCVARRLHIPDMRAPRALPGGRLDARLDTSIPIRVVRVLLDCLRRNEEPRADLFVTETMVADIIHKECENYPDVADKAYDLLLARLVADRPLSKSDETWEPRMYATLQAYKLENLYKAGEKPQAVSGLKALRQRFAGSKGAAAIVDAMLNRFDMEPKPAPTLVFDRTLNGFSGLESLKGKVVLLDFFAHW
jgi:hypothetical protein